jgi:hypothetical protein
VDEWPEIKGQLRQMGRKATLYRLQQRRVKCENTKHAHTFGSHILASQYFYLCSFPSDCVPNFFRDISKRAIANAKKQLGKINSADEVGGRLLDRFVVFITYECVCVCVLPGEKKEPSSDGILQVVDGSHSTSRISRCAALENLCIKSSLRGPPR